MNRIPREAGGRNAPAPVLRRGPFLKDGDEGLDLFSKTRRIHPIGSERQSDAQNEVATRSGKVGRSGMDDLLSSETGKHDYDWLLTPPGTPLLSSLETSEHQLPLDSTRSRSNVRSVSVTKASRLSVSQTENGHSSRPARSSSVTRPSISTALSSSYLSNNSRTSILNTSTGSITSRPSTSGNRSANLSSRTPAPNSRSVSSRSTTPAKTQPPTSSNRNAVRPAHNSRPSTPTGRPQPPGNLNLNSNTLSSRSTSRPSTPTRCTPGLLSTSASAPVTKRSSSINRASTTTTRIPGPASRPASPSPRTRAPVQPIIPPDFPIDVPPNLRTKLPERAVSAGRTRPGMALTVRANSNTETAVTMSSNRRNSSPIVTRGRFPENTPKALMNSNGHDIQKPLASDATTRKPMKPASTTESTGFGRTISKKSIDMALRHMDIKQNMGSIRSAPLFPRSIRSATPRGRQAQLSLPTVHTTDRDAVSESGIGIIAGDCNGSVSESGDTMSRSSDRELLMARASELDSYGSYHCDGMLLKEDSKNMNWLHGIEDKSDQSLELDHRFEPLPEPFSVL